MISLRILWLAIPGGLKRALAGAVALILAFGAGYGLGQRDARHEAALGAAEAQNETRERIDHADPGDLRGVPDADIDDRLRSLGE